jgi:enoyl-CoA hydratase/carnithine racemase
MIDAAVPVPWPLRIAARKVRRKVQDAAARLGANADAPPIYRGKALGWALEGQTLEVELFREPCNELGTTALAELELLADFVRHGAGGARALLFYSSVPKGFCAGADLRELYEGIVQRKAGGASRRQMGREVRSFLDRIHRVFDTFDMAPITTIGAIHGFCFGGGFELALTCDVLVADKSARFAFPELRLGLVPGFGGIPRLRREMGNAAVRDVLLTGRSINAARAHQIGLVSQVVARGQALEVARKVAEQAARFDPFTTRVAKELTKPLPKAELAREKDLFIELLASPVVEAALRKFTESTDVRPYLP